MPPIMRTSDGGLELLEFLPGETLCPDDAPLTFTIVVPEFEEQTLIIYHGERHQWEFPGGGIEPGESPEACAARELWEESSQVAASLLYRGLFKINFARAGKLEYGMLYTARLDALQPFSPNPEADRIMLWDRLSVLDGKMGELTAALLAFC